MGRAGADLRDPQREAAGVAQDLHAAAEGVVFAGVPPVMAALGAGGHPVGRDQRAVQAEEGQAGSASMGQHGAQGGRVRGDHVERFVQVAVGGGDADPGVCGQGAAQDTRTSWHKQASLHER